MSFEGYVLDEKIYESPSTIIYKSTRKVDELPVIIKVLAGEYPTVEQISRFKLEYKICTDLKFYGVVETYGMEKYDNTYAIIMEYFKGRSLDQLIFHTKINLEEFLKIAIQTIEVLGEMLKAP